MRAFATSLILAAMWLAVPAAGASPPVDRDRDGDKVADRLEAVAGARDVVVRLGTDASATRVREVLASAPGARLGVRLPLVDAFAARATPAQIRELAARGDVELVEPDRTATTFDVSSSEGFGVTRARVDIPGLDGDADGDEETYSKNDLVAAVIDTGIKGDHPDLAGKVIGFKDLVNGQEQPYDDQGHGTWVSGILAGKGASGPDGLGVAPGAALVGVKVLDQYGMGSLSGIAAGIQWVVEHRDEYGIDVINLSIGDPRYCGSGEDVASQAVDAAVAAGIVVVAAAGNMGPGPCTVADPGAAVGAIALGAMADPGAGGFHLWFGSSRGPTADTPTADPRIKPDLVGPGVEHAPARTAAAPGRSRVRDERGGTVHGGRGAADARRGARPLARAGLPAPLRDSGGLGRAREGQRVRLRSARRLRGAPRRRGRRRHAAARAGAPGLLRRSPRRGRECRPGGRGGSTRPLPSSRR